MRTVMAHDSLTAKGERRVTPSYVPAIDGFRGLAVLWIVVGHSLYIGTATLAGLGYPLKYVAGGYFLGVDVLFIVSGFVLFLPAARHKGVIADRRQYAARRAARILPGFYLFVVFSYLVARYLGITRGGVASWVAHFLFVHQEAMPLRDLGFAANTPLWTMSVEVLFYLVLPFVAKPFYERPGFWVAISLAISSLWSVLTEKIALVCTWFGVELVDPRSVQDRMAHAFPSYALHFALGMAAAWLFTRVSERGWQETLRPVVRPVALGACVGLFAISYLIGWAYAHGTGGSLIWQRGLLLRVPLFAALVFVTAIASPRAQWIVTNRVSRGLGRFSYGIYLSQMPFIFLLSRGFGLRAPSLTLAAWVIVLAISAGILSGLVVEEPIRRWARRGWAKPGRESVILEPPFGRVRSETYRVAYASPRSSRALANAS